MSKLFSRTAIKLFQYGASNVNKRLSSYKAAIIQETGKPLEIGERKIVSIKSNQVRVQVLYCSVNSADVYKFKHGGGHFPFVPGYELSGDVLEKGSEVPDEKVVVGDRVAGLSLEHFGGLAEQCVLDMDDVWRIPSDVERKDAAVLIYGHSTALYAFSKLAKLNENVRIMISAGPAGLGLAAVDVAANIFKAKVIGLVDTEERGELVRQRGAFETLHFSKNLSKHCMKITKDKGVSVIYDAVGEFMMDSIGSCVSIGGTVVYAAPFYFKTIPAPIPHSFVTIVSLKELRKQNIHLYKTVVNDTLQLANDDNINAHVSATFNLKQINDAVKFIEEKKCTGKVLIHIDD